MTAFDFKKGLLKLGEGVWAYIQPDSSWGLSNAGLITDKNVSLLVDTLYDLALTREMLAAMKEKAGVYSFDKLVNTHDNGDHWFGNMAADASEIIASKACAEARKRYDAGMPAFEAAKDIPIGPYADYGDPERIVLNVNVLYKEFAGDPAPVNPVEQFAAMARWHA